METHHLLSPPLVLVRWFWDPNWFLFQIKFEEPFLESGKCIPILNQADDEDQNYLLEKLLWGVLPFIVRFLGIMISSTCEHRAELSAAGFSPAVSVTALCYSELVRAVLG